MNGQPRAPDSRGKTPTPSKSSKRNTQSEETGIIPEEAFKVTSSREIRYGTHPKDVRLFLKRKEKSWRRGSSSREPGLPSKHKALSTTKRKKE
jgi:hypothetical protein